MKTRKPSIDPVTDNPLSPAGWLPHLECNLFVGASLLAIGPVDSIQSPGPHFKAASNGIRAMCVAFSEPKYNQSPYSRTVVIGE